MVAYCSSYYSLFFFLSLYNSILQTPQVTRAFSFSKTPKRALRRALMSHSATEGRSPSSANENYIGSRLTSTSSLAVSDLAVQAK